MISALCWVPKGAANPVPESVAPPSAEELKGLLLLHQNEVDRVSQPSFDSDNDDEMDESQMQNDAVARALAAAHAVGSNNAQGEQTANYVPDDLAELDMDNYDNEDEAVELFGNGGFGGAYYASNDMDPYLINKESEDEEEIEDMTIKPSDLIILTAHNEDDVSHLEMWVYETETEDGQCNMYVHHDVILPSFPLSVAWLDCNLKGGEKGNFVAVGTMQPEIEIWDLDLLDAVEPYTVLGGAVKHHPMDESIAQKANKRKKKEQVKLKDGSHSDAVLTLAWNTEYRNVLASGSGDCSVKIWDVATQKCEHTIHSHSDKVQAVAWSPSEATVLLSGSFDHTVTLLDMRVLTHKGIKWQVTSDVESLAWDPHAAHSFVVSLEDGTVCNYDIRTVSNSSFSGVACKPLFTIHAHDKAACVVSYNLAAANLLATGSTDKMVKLWDISENHPTCISSRNCKVGAVFAASFCKELPFLLALGGSKGNLEVWDTLAEREVVQKFGKFMQGKSPKNDAEF
eukprot:c25865_g2_i1 orf=232-1767(+)